MSSGRDGLRTAFRSVLVSINGAGGFETNLASAVYDYRPEPGSPSLPPYYAAIVEEREERTPITFQKVQGRLRWLVLLWAGYQDPAVSAATVTKGVADIERALGPKPDLDRPDLGTICAISEVEIVRGDELGPWAWAYVTVEAQYRFGVGNP